MSMEFSNLFFEIISNFLGTFLFVVTKYQCFPQAFHKLLLDKKNTRADTRVLV